jgi:hypothetical protein
VGFEDLGAVTSRAILSSIVDGPSGPLELAADPATLEGIAGRTKSTPAFVVDLCCSTGPSRSSSEPSSINSSTGGRVDVFRDAVVELVEVVRAPTGGTGVLFNSHLR